MIAEAVIASGVNRPIRRGNSSSHPPFRAESGWFVIGSALSYQLPATSLRFQSGTKRQDPTVRVILKVWLYFRAGGPDMFLSVKDLEQRKIQFDILFDAGQLDLLDDRLRQVGPLKAVGSAELLNLLGEIRVSGEVTGTLAGECDRCLEPTSLAVAAGFDLRYSPDLEVDQGDEIEIAEEESEIGFYQGEGLELADIVREQVLLSLPLQRLCSPGCKGLCPTCGQNRNVMNCQCRPAQTDERWAALKQISPTGD